MQFGTLGRGNHFLEFQSDEEQRLWLMVHSGSRGMGQAISAASRPCGRTGIRRQPPGVVRRREPGRPGLSGRCPLGRAIRGRKPFGDFFDRRRIAGGPFRRGLADDSLIHANHNHVRREDASRRRTMGASQRGPIGPAGRSRASFPARWEPPVFILWDAVWRRRFVPVRTGPAER